MAPAIAAIFDDGGVFVQHDARGAADIGRLQERGPIEARRHLGQIGDHDRIVRLVVVAPVRPRPARLRDLRFKIDDPCGVGVRARPASQGQHLFDKGRVQRALGGEIRVGVIVTVRHPEPALRQIDRIVGRVFCIRRDRQVEQRGQEGLRRQSGQAREIRRRRGRAHQIHIRFQRRRTQLFGGRFVHIGLVEQPGLGDRGGRLRAGICRRLFQDRVGARFGQVAQRR